jgi:hypothetical protein
MSAGKAVVHAIANDKVYGDKIAKAIDEISEVTNAALLKELEATRAELAALKAAPAEVPPLDKWRVLATANKIMLREYNNSSNGSANESLCNSVRWALSSILIAERKDREQVYPFKD